jgi:hypothetical protein
MAFFRRLQLAASDDPPYYRRINVVILVPQDIADAANIGPGLAGDAGP